MANLLSFLKGVADYQVKQGENDKDMEMYERKLQLANKLQLQLEENKRMLAEKYPKYQQFFPTATGDVVGVDEQGRSKKVYEADSETKNLLRAGKEAEIGKKKAEAESKSLDDDYKQSQIDYNKERTSHPERFRAEKAPPKDPSLLSGAQADSSYRNWLYQNGPQSTDVTGKVVKEPLPDTPENYQRYQQSAASRGLKLPGGNQPQGASREDLEALQQALGESNLFIEGW